MAILKKAGILLGVCLFFYFYISNSFALVTIVSPSEGQAFYGASTTVSVKLQHTPGYDVGVGFEARKLFIPGQWPDLWKSESVEVLSKTEITPGITVMSVKIPKGGSWRLRASEQPKQAAAPGISGPWHEFAVIAPGQNTAAATISAAPSVFSGKCPVQIYLNGKVGSAIKGTVKYVFIRSWDSVTTPVQSLTFDGPGTVDVTTNFPLNPQTDSTTPSAGWIAIKILGSPEILSNHADYKAVCKYPDLEVVGISGIQEFFGGDETSYSGWKVKIRNKGAGDAEPMDVRLRCEPVSGSGPDGLTPTCPSMFKFTAYSLGKLEAFKEDERNFFPASFTEKWQAGKYRFIVEADYNNKIPDSDKSNNQKTIEVTAKWFPITAIKIDWAAKSYKGVCPANDIPLMAGEMTTVGLGKVKFQYASNTNPAVATYEHIFKMPGEKRSLGIKTATSATTPPTSGWYQVKVLSPTAQESAQAAYTIECVNVSIDPNFLKNIKATFSGWKLLENLAAPPQACQACVGTYNQILGIDQASLPLIQEGECLLGQGGQGQVQMQRLGQIKSQLDEKMGQRKNLINQYKAQLSAFELSKQKSLAPLQRKGINSQP